MSSLHRAIAALTLCLPTAACGIPFFEPVEAVAIASLATVPFLGRALPDVLYSGLTGKDCSVVRLDQGKSYCRPEDPPIEPAPICTRSLGTVDCWIDPDHLTSPAHPLADSQKPTAEQEAYRIRSFVAESVDKWPAF
eukprot:gene16971-17158_t